MSKKINTDRITNELKASSAFFADRTPRPDESDVATSQTDITTSQPTKPIPEVARNMPGDTPAESPEAKSRLEIEKLQTVIKSLSEVPTSAFTTPIRLSDQEKNDIEDFIYGTLRKNGLQGKAVSISKLMRYCMRYVMKVHEEEFVEALKGALHKDTNLPI